MNRLLRRCELTEFTAPVLLQLSSTALKVFYDDKRRGGMRPAAVLNSLDIWEVFELVSLDPKPVLGTDDRDLLATSLNKREWLEVAQASIKFLSDSTKSNGHI